MFESIFSDYVKIGISMLCTAVILASISVCLILSHSYHEKQLQNQIVAEQLQEHRRNIFYNHAHVYQQDIVSVILEYKGDREVRVIQEDGTELSWTKDYASTNYKVSEVSTAIDRTLLYDSELIYGPNLYDVVGYQFTVCDRSTCTVG